MINICLNPPPPPLYSKTSSSSLFFFFSNFLGYSQPHHHHYQPQDRKQKRVVDKRGGRFNIRGRKRILINCGFLPVDPWAPTTNIDSQSIASQLFAASLFPYLGFLYFITKSKSAPKLTLFGFYFLLAFVGATTKVNYGTNLANVDWLHGGAESLLTLTNLFIVMGLRGALRKEQDKNDESTNEVVSTIIKENKKSQ